MADPDRKAQASARDEEQPTDQAAQQLLDECRMVLPGIQALFGFQLIAVFNDGFRRLESSQQTLHLLAIGLIAVAIALIMTPAAYHRQTGMKRVTEHFLTLSSRLLLCSMLPLALGICLEFYLIMQMVLQREHVALALAGALFLVYAGLWFFLPRAGKHRDRADHRDR